MKPVWRFGIIIAALLIFSALVFYLGLVREFAVALIVPALALIGAGIVVARSRRRRKLSEAEKRENQPSSVGGAQQGVATKKSSNLGGIAAGVACLVAAIAVAYHIYHQDKLTEARYAATVNNRCPVVRKELLSKPGEALVKSGGRAIDTLEMERWSKLFHLPPDHKKFLIDVTGEFHGMRFWDGTERDRAQILDYLKSHDGWMSTVPSASFRLRGKGVVTVTVE